MILLIKRCLLSSFILDCTVTPCAIEQVIFLVDYSLLACCLFSFLTSLCHPAGKLYCWQQTYTDVLSSACLQLPSLPLSFACQPKRSSLALVLDFTGGQFFDVQGFSFPSQLNPVCSFCVPVWLEMRKWDRASCLFLKPNQSALPSVLHSVFQSGLKWENETERLACS